MQWKNNIAKGDDYPQYNTAIVAENDSNIEKTGNYTVNKELRDALSSVYSKYDV